MKLADVLLILFLALLSVSSLFGVQALQERSAETDGFARVMYQNELILEIALGNSDYTIHNPTHVLEINRDQDTFQVTGTLGPVTIQRANQMVRVIEQTSPENICELQGATNSPLKPLTCLPNELVVRIERAPSETDEDAILS